jgi:hypothetical protein
MSLFKSNLFDFRRVAFSDVVIQPNETLVQGTVSLTYEEVAGGMGNFFTVLLYFTATSKTRFTLPLF